MGSTKEIQTRMKSIQDTMKITNAMYMISSSKMQKAKRILSDTEPYYYNMQAAISRILRHMPDTEHPFFSIRHKIAEEDRKIGCIVVTGDKGMAGAYNHNIQKMTEQFMAEHEHCKLCVLGDRFKMNLVNCAMIGAFILSMPQRPEVDRLTDYYAKSMMTAPMQWFCRKSGKSKFTAKDIAAMKATAALKAADRNPYSWNMEFYEYPDGSGYEGRFTRCGICVLMKELGLYDLTPALCHLDYTMSEAGGVTDFVRQYTLASGGPYCDCGYKKKKNK